MHNQGYKRIPSSNEDAEGQANNTRTSFPKLRRRHASLLWKLLVILVLVLLSVPIIVFFGVNDDTLKESLKLSDIGSVAFTPRPTVEWMVNGHRDELLRVNERFHYELGEWFNSSVAKEIIGVSIFIDGHNKSVSKVTLNADHSEALLTVDTRKRYRWSSTSLYYVLDIESGSIYHLLAQDSWTSIAHYAPSGRNLAFVVDNDIYIRNSSGLTTRVTSDGGSDIFNGIPDWILEEEIFGKSYTLWWSNDGHYLAYIRTDDSQVDVYPLTYFFSRENVSDPNALLYPILEHDKYSKPGTAIPLTEFYIYDTERSEHHHIKLQEDEANIIVEVLWVGSTTVLVKLMSREADIYKVALVDALTGKYRIVRDHSSSPDGGWFEVTHNTLYVPRGSNRKEAGYIDMVINKGRNHLAYFSPIDSSEPHFITSGPWEVADVPINVDLLSNTVFYTANYHTSYESGVFAAPLFETSTKPEPLLRDHFEGTYSVDYSHDGSFALLHYRGPGIPSQRIVDLKDRDRSLQVVNNTVLETNLAKVDLGEVIFGTFEVEPGVHLNYREIRPTHFNANQKHPILYFSYGGPNSQTVSSSFSIDFSRVYAETHNAIVVTVDPRGTGFMGRDHRIIVRDQLGHYESNDIIAFAREWNKKPYVDEQTTAIWGWSYGGYLSLKVLETDGGDVFKYGVAVAPVTDWRLYDSLYTERYMHSPASNPAGYETSAISNTTSLSGVNRFLIIHGSGDNNVHFQNTMALVDKLDLGGVENYDMHVYPDSDHSISFHEANPLVFSRIDSWLSRHQLAIKDT